MPSPLAVRRLIMEPTASGLASRLGMLHLERAGIDPGPLLKASGLSAEELLERKRIKVRSQIKFLDLISRRTRDDWIGLSIAADFDIRELRMLYYVTASSHQLGDALRRLERYINIQNESFNIKLIQSDNLQKIEMSYKGVPRHIDLHQIECLAYSVLRLCRHLTGRKLVPVTASFAHHRSGDLQKICRLFGCPVVFDALSDEICFAPNSTSLLVVGEDPFLSELMVNACEEAVALRSSPVSSFRTCVEQTIAPLLPHSGARATIVARRLGLSERTFARRLAAEGLNFSLVLDELRRDLAVRYLSEQLQSSQITWLLGFKHASAFNNACRRWTGKSPLNFEQLIDNSIPLNRSELFRGHGPAVLGPTLRRVRSPQSETSLYGRESPTLAVELLDAFGQCVERASRDRCGSPAFQRRCPPGDIPTPMNAALQTFALVFASIFPIVNPPGSALVFLGLTRGAGPEIRGRYPCPAYRPQFVHPAGKFVHTRCSHPAILRDFDPYSSCRRWHCRRRIQDGSFSMEEATKSWKRPRVEPRKQVCSTRPSIR